MHKRVLVTGSSGMIGSALSKVLSDRAYSIRTLSRSKESLSEGVFYWNPLAGELDPSALEGVDAIVHLAGESISQRWTLSAREAILNSRVLGTRTLVEAMKASDCRADLITSSGINFYGCDVGYLEEGGQGSGTGFLSEVCRKWETEAQCLKNNGNRLVVLRTGVVLNRKGGAMARLLPAFQFGLGGRVGSGEQWMSWIELSDLVEIIIWAIEGDYEGTLNAVSPNPVTNREFVNTLGSVLKKPTFFPLPSWVVQLIFGRMGEETVLADIGVLPEVLKQAGFRWQCPEIRSALIKSLEKDA
jgi:uncharacterized protein (TIGR01777 family)